MVDVTADTKGENFTSFLGKERFLADLANVVLCLLLQTCFPVLDVP